MLIDNCDENFNSNNWQSNTNNNSDNITQIFNVIEKNNPPTYFDNTILLYTTPEQTKVPSTIYKWTDFLKALKIGYQDGFGNEKFYMGDTSPNGWKYGLVNIAAFLAQSMAESIQFDACDENNWSVGSNLEGTLIDGKGNNEKRAYPLSAACGQAGQKYGEYKCPVGMEHMMCPENKNMIMMATTNAKWYGAPGPLFCAPKSVIEKTGYWDKENPSWCDPKKREEPITDVNEYIKYIKSGQQNCRNYANQKAGSVNNQLPVKSTSGRDDVEGCGWWGRGVIQTTGRCNYGILNYYIGKRAADEGRPSKYPTVDFCANPQAVCGSKEYPELKWIAGLLYWNFSVQKYDAGGWNYLTELKKFVDGGMQNPGSDAGFIHGVSGIVNRGCHNPNCGSGDLISGPERAHNFKIVLDAFGLTKI